LFFLSYLGNIWTGCGIKLQIEPKPVKMKKVKLHLPFIAMILGISLFLQHCTKDDPDSSSGIVSSVNGVNDFSGNILQFLGQAENPPGITLQKSGNFITVDSAIKLIDVSLNYAYCFHDAPHLQLITDTVHSLLPVTRSNMVNTEDVVSSFNAAVDSIRIKFEALKGSNKKLTGVIVENLGNRSESFRLLRIIFITAMGIPPVGVINPPGIFTEEDEFWYEKGSFRCDGTGIHGAPDILEYMTWMKYLPVVPPGYRVWYHSTVCYYPDCFAFQVNIPPDNYCDFLIFYACENYGELTSETKCLNYNQNGSGIHEMEFYLNGADYILNYWLLNYNENNKVFQNCSFTHKQISHPVEKIFHEESFYFGIRIISRLENKYPVSII